MTKRSELYKCEICGNLTEVVGEGAGELVCCGQPMVLLEAKTEDQGKEKHVPVIEKKEEGILVKVGSIPHPMEDSHYIQWIEVVADGISYKKFLKPSDAPEACFCCLPQESLTVRELCNLHGLWQSKA